jgi:hypothetical protein
VRPCGAAQIVKPDLQAPLKPKGARRPSLRPACAARRAPRAARRAPRTDPLSCGAPAHADERGRANAALQRLVAGGSSEEGSGDGEGRLSDSDSLWGAGGPQAACIMPVAWHQTLLCFRQRHKAEVRAADRNALRRLYAARQHCQVAPEALWDLDRSAPREQRRAERQRREEAGSGGGRERGRGVVWILFFYCGSSGGGEGGALGGGGWSARAGDPASLLLLVCGWSGP